MLPSKRGADDLSRFSTDSSISGFWSELSDEAASKLSKSVVSIALTHGDLVGQNVLFASCGIAIECQPNFTKFVTSAILVRALNTERNGHDNIKIEVCHKGNVAIGTVVECDLDHVIAVVEVTSALDVCCVPLSHAEKLMPDTKVVAVGRDISGKLMATSGTLANSGRPEDRGHLMFSTCKLSEVMQGGALFEFDGNFVGMNLFSNMERPIFLPRDIIFDRLNHFQTSMEKIIFPMLLKSVRHRKRLTGVELHSYPEGSTSVNTFGEQFGDEYPTGVWGKFKKEVSSNISEIVVAVASFHGETKFFACTGFFINYDGCPTILTSASLVRDPDGANEIVSSLRIEVLLPNKDHTVGELEHYSLHYNVALVSVKNYNVDCPKLKCELMRYCGTVVAVGRCFESGILMATSGEFIHDCDEESIDSDCEYFSYTTCRTTKVVIGGPVVDLDGKFVGINYYDTKIGTPLLCFIDICEILDDLKTKKAMIGGHEGRLKNDDGPPNIWILPA
ncbi:uncharacterized protein LOC8064571 isoform X3 [Sorghum bicolor]|nr:uncharacterized protein LOC8064571 isoform X3 [Sorghum bicolor]XP_021302155.1 uncharacterized protein LOC8064571 isoform X3 [Sorghum bicolor]|eukprot:XP_002443226.2 uncharacterized protein LOC8064571 isoform X3 [Sorghum bicolor]